MNVTFEITDKAAIVRFGELEEFVVIESANTESAREALMRACAKMLNTLREITKEAQANRVEFENHVVALLRTSL